MSAQQTINVDAGGQVIEVTSSLAAPSGDAAPLNDHIANQRPHTNAESGRDFAAWFNAQLT